MRFFWSKYNRARIGTFWSYRIFLSRFLRRDFRLEACLGLIGCGYLMSQICFQNLDPT